VLATPTRFECADPDFRFKPPAYYELKRDYQKWLHERDRDRDDYDGHPDRDPHEIEEWAREHDLPYFDEQVHFPDADRIRGCRWPLGPCRCRGRDRPLPWCARGRDGAVWLQLLRRIERTRGRRQPSRWTRRGAAAMNFEDRVKAVAEFGYTERQARFLVTVMLQSGVCVPRQYAKFAGTADGHKVSKFFDKLASREHATVSGCLHNRAQLYHVKHHALYRAIGQPHNRYRRPLAADR
jgi:hypothetical protein